MILSAERELLEADEYQDLMGDPLSETEVLVDNEDTNIDEDTDIKEENSDSLKESTTGQTNEMDVGMDGSAVDDTEAVDMAEHDSKTSESDVNVAADVTPVTPESQKVKIYRKSLQTITIDGVSANVIAIEPYDSWLEEKVRIL